MTMIAQVAMTMARMMLSVFLRFWMRPTKESMLGRRDLARNKESMLAGERLSCTARRARDKEALLTGER